MDVKKLVVIAILLARILFLAIAAPWILGKFTTAGLRNIFRVAFKSEILIPTPNVKNKKLGILVATAARLLISQVKSAFAEVSTITATNRPLVSPPEIYSSLPISDFQAVSQPIGSTQNISMFAIEINNGVIASYESQEKRPSKPSKGEPVKRVPLNPEEFIAKQINDCLAGVESEIVALSCEHNTISTEAIETARRLLTAHPNSIIKISKTSQDQQERRLTVLGSNGELDELLIPHGWMENEGGYLQTNVASGPPILTTRALFEELGGFSEDFDGISEAVVDFTLRGQEVGATVWELFDANPPRNSNSAHSCSHSSPLHPNTFKASLVQERVNTLERFAVNLIDQSSEKILSSLETKSPTGKSQTGNPTRVLYFSPFQTHPTSHGNRATMVSFGKAMKKMGHKLLFVAPSGLAMSRQDKRDMLQFWENASFLDPFVLGNSFHFSKYGARTDSWFEEELGLQIRKLAVSGLVDVVFCSYVFHSKMLDYVPEYMTKVIDTHDKMSDRFLQLEELGIPLEFFSCPPEDEALYLSRADVIVARTDTERNWFSSLVPNKEVVTVAHFDEPQFVGRAAESHQMPMRYGILASDNEVNKAIVDNFLKELILFTKSSSPQKRVAIEIAGNVKSLFTDHYLTQLSSEEGVNVSFTGFVESLEDFYSRIDCLISPVHAGTGMNVKSIEAIQRGVALLSTLMGSKGISTGEPLHQMHDVRTLVEKLHILNSTDIERLSLKSQEIALISYQTNFEALTNVISHGSLSKRSSK